MFAKGYTNIRAMIETQYGILSHMITDIAYRYQTLLKQTEEESDRLAQNNSDGDHDVYHSILNSLSDVEERSYCLMTESRKILFCAIFSYYETMLNEFVLYYKIANNATLPSQILDSILKAYKTKYGEEITCIEENVEYANSFYRLLRNLYLNFPAQIGHSLPLFLLIASGICKLYPLSYVIKSHIGFLSSP